MELSLILIHRLLQSFFLPPLNGLLIIILGLIFLYWKKVTGKFFIIIGMMVIYLQATPFVANYMSKKIELESFNESEMPMVQAIIVLGGGINNNTSEYGVSAMANNSTFSRLRYTAYLAKQYPSKIIIVTGGALSYGDSEAKVMKRALINEFGVTNTIITEDRAVTTNENAKFVSHILQQYNINNVLIITQAFHAKRAIALFNKYGVSVFAGSTDYYATGYYIKPILWFLPTASAMLQTSNVLREYVGYLYDMNANMEE